MQTIDGRSLPLTKLMCLAQLINGPLYTHVIPHCLHETATFPKVGCDLGFCDHARINAYAFTTGLVQLNAFLRG